MYMYLDPMSQYAPSYFIYYQEYTNGTVSSKITLAILFQILQDKQIKSNALIEMYGKLRIQSLITPQWIVLYLMHKNYWIEKLASS